MIRYVKSVACLIQKVYASNTVRPPRHELHPSPCVPLRTFLGFVAGGTPESKTLEGGGLRGVYVEAVQKLVTVLNRS